MQESACLGNNLLAGRHHDVIRGVTAYNASTANARVEAVARVNEETPKCSYVPFPMFSHQLGKFQSKLRCLCIIAPRAVSNPVLSFIQTSLNISIPLDKIMSRNLSLCAHSKNFYLVIIYSPRLPKEGILIENFKTWVQDPETFQLHKQM